jgi:hypothetical protein
MCHWQLREAPDSRSINDLRFLSPTCHRISLFVSPSPIIAEKSFSFLSSVFPSPVFKDILSSVTNFELQTSNLEQFVVNSLPTLCPLRLLPGPLSLQLKTQNPKLKTSKSVHLFQILPFESEISLARRV